MSYEERRDAYLQHVKKCEVCVSSYTCKQKAFVMSGGNLMKERYATISSLCAAAKTLAEGIV